VNRDQHLKVTASHLQRLAYLYVRQSTLRQVFENTESTRRQYALRERAVALGWPLDRVVVIDSDLGQSGADSDREGFQKLVAAVGMGEVGVVLGLEVSRLARSSSDWHRLLEISRRETPWSRSVRSWQSATGWLARSSLLPNVSAKASILWTSTTARGCCDCWSRRCG